jgi:hypothetical protein
MTHCGMSRFINLALLMFVINVSFLGHAQSVSDLEVEIGSAPKFSEHFENWRPGTTTFGKALTSGSIITFEVLAAGVLGSAAQRRLFMDPNMPPDFDQRFRKIKAPYNRRVPFSVKAVVNTKKMLDSRKVGYGFVAGSLYLAADATVGTVTAIQGNKPLVMLNVPALASYIVRNQLDEGIREQVPSEQEIIESATLMKLIYGANVERGQVVSLNQHFDDWSDTESQILHNAKVFGTHGSLALTSTGIFLLAKKHKSYSEFVRSSRGSSLSQSSLRSLDKSERVVRRYGNVAKVGALIFFAESISGTVVAIKGNKPVYVGNLAGLTSYGLKRIATDEATDEAIGQGILQSIYATQPPAKE